MSSEKLKEIIVTNPAKKSKKTKKKGKSKGTRKRTAAKVASAPAKKKRRKSRKGRKGSSRKTTRRARRRNPGLNLGAAGAQMLGGAVAFLVAQPLAHVVGSKIENPKVRGAVRTAIAAAAPAAAGLALSGMAPNVAGGMFGAAGALAAAHGLNAVGNLGATPNALLQKAGFTQLGNAGNVFERDGILWRTRDDGIEEALAGVGNTPVIVALDDGQELQGVLAGAFDDGSAIVKVGDDYMLIPAQATEGVGELVQDLSGGVGELVQDLSGLGSMRSSLG